MPDEKPTDPQAETRAETKAKFQVDINAGVEAVWKEITRTDAPIAAFFNARMEVGAFEPGARLAMRSGKYTGVVGRIVEFDPPRRFAHTFRFTNLDDPECVVTYDLESQGDGTRFTLTITDMPTGTKTAKQMQQGGRMIVETLKSVMETGKPAFGTRMLYVLFKILAPMTPSKCRNERWPVTD